MKLIFKIAPLTLALLLGATLNTAYAANKQQNRYALLISSKEGGPTRETLRYSDQDRKAMSQVLTELGGLPPDNLFQLEDPGIDQIAAAFAKMESAIKLNAGEAPPNAEFIFYYSGHSDETGIILGRQTLAYSDIKNLAAQLPVSLRIFILDSCNSGAFTLLKGGARIEPIAIADYSRTEGFAALTSSSADEASQESARIKGSYFTHFLTAGLRGAADGNHDGLVTLTEAYRFAYSETTSIPEGEKMVDQQPNFAINISGSAEPVITDISNRTAGLHLAKEVAGRVYIKDSANRLLLQLNKSPGKKVEIGLVPGRYTILLDHQNNYYSYHLNLVKGEDLILNLANFTAAQQKDLNVEGEVVFFQFSFPDISNLTLASAKHVRGIHLTYLYGQAASLTGLAVGMSHRSIGDVKGGQIGIANLTQGDLIGFQNGVANAAFGDTTGVQNGVLNYSNSITGLQNGVVNANLDSARGLQNGVVNMNRQNMDGVQNSVVNVNLNNMRGVQNGVVNMNRQNMDGVQNSVINMNLNSLRGLQVGVVNYSKDVQGAQIGIVNVSRTLEGAPIGLINVILEGGMELGFWSSGKSPFNIEYKSRGKYGHGLMSIGYDPGTIKHSQNVSLGFGFGLHFNIIQNLQLDLDLMAQMFYDNPTYPFETPVTQQSAVTARLLFGYTLMKKITMFAGPAYVYQYEIEFDGPSAQFADYHAGLAYKF